MERDRKVRLSTMSGALIRDTRDKPLDAHRGVYSTVNLGITPVALGSSANFVRFSAMLLQTGAFNCVGQQHSPGHGRAFAGSFVPTSQLYFSGGGTSLRASRLMKPDTTPGSFLQRSENQSGCVNVTVPVGGRQLFILNSEVRSRWGL